jgi:hypothetical protein
MQNLHFHVSCRTVSYISIYLSGGAYFILYVCVFTLWGYIVKEFLFFLQLFFNLSSVRIAYDRVKSG